MRTKASQRCSPLLENRFPCPRGLGSVVVAVALVACSACAGGRSGPRITSVAYVDPPQAAALRTFEVVRVGQCDSNALLEQQLLDILADGLEARGLTREANSPDAIVLAACQSASEEHQQPGSTLYIPLTNLYTGESMGVMSQTTPGTVTTIYARALVVQVYLTEDLRRYFSAAEAGENPQRPVPVWDGRATTATREADLLTVAGQMFDDMLAKAPLGKSPGRQ